MIEAPMVMVAMVAMVAMVVMVVIVVVMVKVAVVVVVVVVVIVVVVVMAGGRSGSGAHLWDAKCDRVRAEARLRPLGRCDELR